MDETRELKLWDDPAVESTLKLFLNPGAGPGEPRPLVVVLPGGGYYIRAPHEADPVAQWFNRLGFHAAVCHYRVVPHRYPAALSDAQRAIRTVRHNAAAWGVDPNRIGALGFSAGGHLACCCANFGDDGLPEGDAIARTPSRANALIACYPVTSFIAEFAHFGSRDAILGDEPDPELVHKLSVENTVTPQNPPAFLWHTAEDNLDVRNPLIYASALAAAKIPFALHVYPRGPHGLGLAETHATSVRNWPRDCAEWFAEINWMKEPQA